MKISLQTPDEDLIPALSEEDKEMEMEAEQQTVQQERPPRRPRPPVKEEIDIEELKKSLTKQIIEEMNKNKEDEEAKERQRLIDQMESEKEEEKPLPKGKRRKAIPKTNAQTNEDYYYNYKLKIRNQRIKKLIFTLAFYIFTIGLLACNVYFLFIKKPEDIKQTASNVKTIIGFTTYPKEGVEDYLIENFQSILKDNNNDQDVFEKQGLTLEDICVRKVAPLTDSCANVFFTAKINQPEYGTKESNFILCLNYDNITKSYIPASKLMNRITTDNDEVEYKKDNDSVWYIKDENLEDDKDKIDKAKEFLTQFFTMLYSNKTIPNDSFIQMDYEIYFDNEGLDFDKINDIKLYKEYDVMQMNCEVTYTVKMQNDVTYQIVSYLRLKQGDDGSFKIEKIM